MTPAQPAPVTPPPEWDTRSLAHKIARVVGIPLSDTEMINSMDSLIREHAPPPAPSSWAFPLANEIDRVVRQFTGHEGGLPDFTPMILKYAPPAPSCPTERDGERIAANAALLRLFKNEYRESSDRHSDSLFVRDYVQGMEAQLGAALADVKRLYELGASRNGHFPKVAEENMALKAKVAALTLERDGLLRLIANDSDQRAAPPCPTEQGEPCELVIRKDGSAYVFVGPIGDLTKRHAACDVELPAWALETLKAAISRQPAPSADAGGVDEIVLPEEGVAPEKWMRVGPAWCRFMIEESARLRELADHLGKRVSAQAVELAQLRSAPSAVAKDRAEVAMVVERLKFEVSTYAVLKLTPPEYLTDAISLLSQPAVAQTEAGNNHAGTE